VRNPGVEEGEKPKAKKGGENDSRWLGFGGRGKCEKE